MNVYERVCLIVALLTVVVTLANIIVFLLRKRSKPQFVQEMALQPEQSDDGITLSNADATVVDVIFDKSFKAELSQANEDVRQYYNTLKNHVLSYMGVKTGISWTHESARYGKVEICRFVLRDNTLQVYLPVNADNYYLDTNYKVERTEQRLNKKPSCLYKVINTRRVQRATELIDTVMRRFKTERKKTVVKDYAANYPYEDDLSLIERKLIKVTELQR